MEVLIIIAVLILAIVAILVLVGGLLWAEKGVNNSTKRLNEQWQAQNDEDSKDSTQ